MLVVWDYFGVLAQDSFWYTAERIAAGKPTSQRMHEMHIKADLGQITWEEYCREVSNDIGVAYDEVVDRYQRHNIKQSVVSAIKSVSSEHSQVILSNASAEYLLPIVSHLGLDKLFSGVYVSSMIGYAKPDIRAFRHVLMAENIEPNQAIMIDDSERNVEAASSIGMKGIVFRQDVDIATKLHSLLS